MTFITMIIDYRKGHPVETVILKVPSTLADTLDEGSMSRIIMLDLPPMLICISLSSAM